MSTSIVLGIDMYNKNSLAVQMERTYKDYAKVQFRLPNDDEKDLICCYSSSELVKVGTTIANFIGRKYHLRTLRQDVLLCLFRDTDYLHYMLYDDMKCRWFHNRLTIYYDPKTFFNP